MAIERINLDKEVGRLVHLPRYEDIPLYTRIPDCKEEYINKSEDLRNRSDAWIKKSNLTYNSPNNIRRLFITSEGVSLHFYQPLVAPGGGNKSLMRSKKHPRFKPTEVYDALMMGSTDYIITKSGLGALSYPWVASNIEEVYFDWSVLLSTDVMNMGLGNLLVDLNSVSTTSIEKSDLPYKIFKYFCGRGENIENKFPRLKVVGYIQQLDRVYQMIENKKGRESLDDISKLWCANLVIKAAGADPNCRVMLHYVDNVPRINLKYRLRDGIYLYDREVLLPYFNGIKERVEVAIDNEPKSEYEKILDKVYNSSGSDKAKLVLRVSLMDMSNEVREEAFREMSSKGRDKYMKLLK